jgi:hypothetical protein
MNQEFQKYNAITDIAFSELIRKDELVAKKTQNIERILSNKSVKTVLHLGYGPIAEGLKAAGYDVVLADTLNLHDFGAVDFNLRYDAVIAPDEYFTFAASEDAQRKLLETVFDLTRRVLVTTLSDYKNMTDNRREFGDPQSYKTQQGSSVYLERNLRDNKSSWQTKVYRITDDDNCTTYGPFQRRSLFFKQLARMSEDSGSTEFEFQKNIMYKGMTKKCYEHVIVVNFG